MNIIKQKIPVSELMAGLAEECCELAQAALKLRRVWDGTNPTPMTEDMAIERFYEEIADVRLYLNQIDVNVASIEEIMAEKEARWKNRISEME
jgi:NTP pyrophosphatase (non-canonical NTP hydrolase)